MKFSLLINTKLAFSYLLVEKFSHSDMYSKKELAIDGNLRLNSMKNFMLSCVEHEKFYNLGASSRFPNKMITVLDRIHETQQ